MVFGDSAFVIMNSFSVHNLHKGFGGRTQMILYSPAEYKTIKLQLCPGSDVLILYGGTYLALQHLTHQHDEATAPK